MVWLSIERHCLMCSSSACLSVFASSLLQSAPCKISWQCSGLCFKPQRITVTILAAVSFSVIPQAPLKTPLLPSGIVNTVEIPECELHAESAITSDRYETDWVKVVSELLLLLLRGVFPVALVGCLKTSWLLVVTLCLCCSLWSVILSLKVFQWSPNCTIPSVNSERKGHMVSYLIVFQAIEQAGTLLNSCLVLHFLACQEWALLDKLCRGAAWDLAIQGAISVRISSRCFWVPFRLCCGRAHDHFIFCFRFVLAAAVWAL